MSRYCEVFQLACAKNESKRTIQLDDGGEYFGEVNNHLAPNGQGIEFYPNGSKRYEGQFVNGTKTGKGIFFYKSGRKAYAGQFENNHMHGQGTLFDPKNGSLLFRGSLFHGSFYNGTFFNQ